MSIYFIFLVGSGIFRVGCRGSYEFGRSNILLLILFRIIVYSDNRK